MCIEKKNNFVFIEKNGKEQKNKKTTEKQEVYTQNSQISQSKQRSYRKIEIKINLTFGNLICIYFGD